MASELRVNTLKDASGNNSVATSVVFGGTAKAWLNFNQIAPSTRDSFNVSSMTDTATGKYAANWTSNFDNVNYSSCENHAGDNGEDYGNYGVTSHGSWNNYSGQRTAGLCQGSTYYYSGNYADFYTVEGQFVGDLA